MRTIAVLALCIGAMAAAGAAQTSISTVASADGTSIAGPSLVIVHGGTGDRTRCRPLLPLFGSKFRACAMVRRGHGASGDTISYSLQREVEDVVAVVAAQPGPAFVLGHSFGAVCAFEAAFHTSKIARLALYERPVRLADHSAVLARMEAMLLGGDREGALVTFMSEIVLTSTNEVAAMKARPSWAGLRATVEASVRQDRALSQYQFDPVRARTMAIPTLLMAGSKTTSPELMRSIDSLRQTLPHSTLRMFEGQEHKAMDTIPRSSPRRSRCSSSRNLATVSNRPMGRISRRVIAKIQPDLQPMRKSV
jgi:pimeloyl-ACP methyl ester carboxylesterase